MGDEKRGASRIHKAIMVRYCVGASGEAKKWDITTVKDISETGICLTVNEFLPPGSNLNFLIKIPLRPTEWLEFNGKVISSEKIGFEGSYLVRAEFVDLNEGFKKLLHDYIAWCLKVDK